MHPNLDIAADVRAALAEGAPVVALESTLITHGLPWPDNLACARAAERSVRTHGATPATIAILDGRVRVGLADVEVERLARGTGARKVSRRDLALTLAGGQTGATTVSATMLIAAMAGIEIFATGGIGGVHRDAESTFDISADLTELGRTPVTVVCAGVKIILDLPRTLEVLETAGVPVVGFATDEFPGFFCARTGLPVDQRLDRPGQVAALIRMQRSLGLASGVLVARPPPVGHAIEPERVEAWVESALAQAREAGVTGKAMTPFLLSALARLSGGRTLATNVALIEANAALAAQIAVALVAGASPAPAPTHDGASTDTP